MGEEFYVVVPGVVVVVELEDAVTIAERGGKPRGGIPPTGRA